MKPKIIVLTPPGCVGELFELVIDNEAVTIVDNLNRTIFKSISKFTGSVIVSGVSIRKNKFMWNLSGIKPKRELRYKGA